MITGKYDRQLDRSNRSKNIHDLALGSDTVPKIRILIIFLSEIAIIFSEN